MISYIKGLLSEIIQDIIIIESNNIGYEINVPLSIINKLPDIGNQVKIYTYLNHREDAMILYGFLTRDDLNIFKKIIMVNGIGPKGALGILSTITPDELRFAVISNDVKTIVKAPGIGKKTAQKLILELKDKIDITDIETTSDIQQGNSFHSSNENKKEAIQALIALGYTSNEALQVIKQIQISDNTTVENIIKQALKKLAKM